MLHLSLFISHLHLLKQSRSRLLYHIVHRKSNQTCWQKFTFAYVPLCTITIHCFCVKQTQSNLYSISTFLLSSMRMKVCQTNSSAKQTHTSWGKFKECTGPRETPRCVSLSHHSSDTPFERMYIHVCDFSQGRNQCFFISAVGIGLLNRPANGYITLLVIISA